MKFNRIVVFFVLFSAFFSLGFSQGSKSTWMSAFLHSRPAGGAAFDPVEETGSAHAPLPLPPAGSGEGAGDHVSRSAVETNSDPTATAPTPAPAALEGQLNLLIIGVNHLQAQEPRLESVWVALTIPGSPRLTLMPVYPTPAQELNAVSTEKSLPLQFGLDAAGHPSPEFLASLKTTGLWWSGYLMIDQIALIELVEFVNDLDIEAEDPINGVLAVTGLADPEEDSRGNLQGQTELAAELCRRTIRLAPAVDMAPLLALFPKHARTDLHPSDLVAAWKTMRETNRGLACEFPAQLPTP